MEFYLSGVRAADSLDGVKDEQESRVAERRVTISAYLCQCSSSCKCTLLHATLCT